MFAPRPGRRRMLVLLALVLGMVVPVASGAVECDRPLPDDPSALLTLCSPDSSELSWRIVPEGLELSWNAPPRGTTSLRSDLQAVVWSVPEGDPPPGLTLSGTYLGVEDRRIELAIVAINGGADSVGVLGVDEVRVVWSSVFEATAEGVVGDVFVIDSTNVDTALPFRIVDPILGRADSSIVPGVRLRFQSGVTVETNWNAVFDVEDFEGYHVWRWFSDPTAEPAVWGEYSKLADTRDPGNAWIEATPQGNRFVFVDRAVFDGDVYHYAVTTYDQGFRRQRGGTLGFKFDSPLPPATAGPGGDVQLGKTMVRVDFLRPPPEAFRAIAAVPNPFRQARCDRELEDITCTVRFLNMPAQGRLLIYTLSGELVQEIFHDDATTGTLRWNTRNADNREVASGVYIYKAIDLQSGQQSFGRLVIIR